MSWVITKDEIFSANKEIATERSAVGTIGPSTCTKSAQEIINHPKSVKFRMKDDDGVIYYEGFLIGDEFAPLDDFGEPNAGCTSIEVFEHGKWVLV
jgi:hypothetical protein